MRYDDTFETVLASDLSTPYGKQSAWRQLVDLIGRRRIGADSRALAVLRGIQSEVPPAVRAASARGLEYADPPPPLVRLLARDLISVAAPILRTARMSSGDWILMLPELGPEGRAILRHRRDMSPLVQRALESFGPNDFALADARALEARSIAVEAMVVPAAAVTEATATIAEVETREPMIIAVAEPTVTAEPVIEAAQAEATGEEEVVEPPLPAALPLDWTLVTRFHEIVAALPAAEVEAADLIEAETHQTEPYPAATAEIAALVATIPELLMVRDIAPVSVAEQAPVAEVEAAPAAETETEVDEDHSYIALALGAGGAFAPSTGSQASVATSDSDDAVQSETVVTTDVVEPVAGLTDAAQGRDMLEQSETLALLASDPLAVEAETVNETALIVQPVETDQEGPFQIADVVARIDAFWRNRDDASRAQRAVPRADGFRFETDPEGVIRWVDGVSRNPIIGLSLELHGAVGVSRVDGVAAGAFRRRASFTNARLEIEGQSDAAGGWLISGVPVFDAGNGRFTGYRGTARRPRIDERAEPPRQVPALAPDSLRQLVHELRTPTNAIAGFAEMIESEMLGPVPDGYRDRASTIRSQARDLLGAIDDLDLAARIESAALSLAPSEVALRPMLATICDDLAQLTAIRGSWIALPIDNLAVRGDRRAIERLLSRLMATLVSASGDGERIGVRLMRDSEAMVAISIDRPSALADYPGDSLLGIDDEGDDATLLGTGFALRLARNLARELGGSMVIEPENLTLRLPAPEEMKVEQAHLN